MQMPCLPRSIPTEIQEKLDAGNDFGDRSMGMFDPCESAARKQAAFFVSMLDYRLSLWYTYCNSTGIGIEAQMPERLYNNQSEKQL